MASESTSYLAQVPVGSFTWWFGLPEKKPLNWLICNGNTFDETVYPELYEILGSNTLPNLVGRFIKGVGGTTNSADPTDKSDLPNQPEEAGLPDIEGNICYAGHQTTPSTYGNGAFDATNTYQHELNFGNPGTAHTGNSGQVPMNFKASRGTVLSENDDDPTTYMTQEDSPYGKSSTVTPANISAIPLIRAK